MCPPLEQENAAPNQTRHFQRPPSSFAHPSWEGIANACAGGKSAAHLAERLGHVVHGTVRIHHRVLQQSSGGLDGEGALVIRFGRVMGAHVAVGATLRSHGAARGRLHGATESVHAFFCFYRARVRARRGSE